MIGNNEDIRPTTTNFNFGENDIQNPNDVAENEPDLADLGISEPEIVIDPDISFEPDLNDDEPDFIEPDIPEITPDVPEPDLNDPDNTPDTEDINDNQPDDFPNDDNNEDD